MKRLIIVGLSIICSELLFAAPFPTPNGIAQMTRAQVLNSTPTVSGLLIICTDCQNVQNGVGFALCVSTEAVTARNAFIVEGSSPTAVTACQ